MAQPSDFSTSSGGGMFSSAASTPDPAPVFGSAASKTTSGFGAFGAGGQSPPSSSFGGLSEQSRSSFGTFGSAVSQGNPPGQRPESVFGAAKPGSSGSRLFKGQSSQALAKPSGTFGSVPNVFGGQPLFGAGSPSKSTPGSFGNAAAPASSKTLFGVAADPATSQGLGNKSPSSALFAAKSPQVSSNPFASSQSASTATNVFGASKPLFTGATTAPPSQTSFLGAGEHSQGDAADGDFRKRSSSGTMGSSVLFGKKQTARAAASTAVAGGNLFTSASQEAVPKPTGERKLFGKDPSPGTVSTPQGLFGAKPPPSSEPGHAGLGAAQPQFPSVTSTAASGPSRVREVSALSSAPSAMFGKAVAPSSSSNAAASSSSGSNTNPFLTNTSASSIQLFGKTDPPQRALFGKANEVREKVLFGKPHGDVPSEKRSGGLFGKPYGDVTSDQSSGASLVVSGQAPSSQLFQGQKAAGSESAAGNTNPQQFQQEEGQEASSQGTEVHQQHLGSTSPRRSLSKWNKNRSAASVFEKKRTGEEVDSREAKRVRASDRQGEKTSPSPLFSRSRLASARQQSIEEQSQKTCIIVRDIPVHLNKGQILREHFSQFGTIKRLQPMPTKNSANISFQTHAEARSAKEEGKRLGGGPPLTIFWRNVATKSPGSASTLSSARSPEVKPRQTQGEILKTQGHLQDELSSMAGTFDHQEDIAPERSRPRAPRERPKASSSASPVRRQPETRAAERRRSPTPPHRREEDTETKGMQDSETKGVQDLEIAKKLLKVMWKARPKDATETVAVLDARDKFLRMLRGRQSDLASAQAFTGACGDMCAEKERYYREDIRRLALYEVIPSTMTSVTGLKSKVDHARAVKEYSRSSADQEEPLPHELRPLPVLVTTMTYLLTEVADQGGEGKWSEWYDFLWNRTRGIRKDITQQQLCEVEVAELLEKCARFHIFCSARLCEEDMMSFDAKINNENLTKCLQTLKELYADLEKRKVTCPNEAEFRAFMVLMNLNEGDTLREVQQLSPEIRESPYINFALKAYHALNSSNYVRFFRLIREATFLNACALHRYFNQIRGQALRIIMKAHRATGRNRVMYPVGELIRLLGFEDSAAVAEFCDHYCLTVEGDEIVMDAQAFLEPEGSIRETRSQTLVEAKRAVSVGEIINGRPLPPLQLPTPSSSFDESGTFILPAAIHEAVSKGLITTARSVPPPQTQMPSVEDGQRKAQELSAPVFREGLPNAAEVQRNSALYSNDAIKSIVRTLILDEIDAGVLTVASEAVAEEKHHVALISAELEDLTSVTVRELASAVAEEAVEEEEATLRQKLAQEMAAQRQRVFGSLCEGVVEDTVSELVDTLAREEMSVVNAELHRQRVDRCALSLRDDTLAVAVETMILDVAQEVFEVDVLAKRERLAATEACVVELRLRRFFQVWRRNYLAQVRVKRAMLDFPSTAPSRPLKEQLQMLVPDRPDSRLVQQSFFISDRAKLTVQSPMEVIQQQLFLSTRLSMASARRMLAGLVLWRPLDLSHTVTPQIYRAFSSWLEDGLIEPDTTPLQWKLCVSFPKREKSTSELEASFEKWVRAKLCQDAARDKILEATPKAEGEVLSLYHLNTDGRKGKPAPLGICIRSFHGKWTDDQEIDALKKDLLKGSSALLFVGSCAEDLRLADFSAKTSPWANDRRRLHQMLKQKPKHPTIPLVVLVPMLSGEAALSVADLDVGLGLSQLHTSGLVSAVHVSQIYIGAQDHPVEFFSEWTSQLSNCLRFAASHVPAPPKLRAKPVSSYVEDVVIELFKAPVYQDLRTRTRLQLLHQSPNILVALYNDVIEHVALACASDDLRMVSWPAPEFDKSKVTRKGPCPRSDWNSEGHLCDLYELVSKLRLPYFRYSDMEAGDWTTACRDVWAYLASVTRKDSGSAKICLFQQTAELLSRTKKSFDQLCWLASEDGPCEPTYTNMAWTDLVDLCIHYKLLSLRSGHLDIRKPDADDDEEIVEKVEDFEEAVVFYQEDDVEDFEPPAGWTEALRDTETTEGGQLKPAVQVAAAKRDQTLLEESARKDSEVTQHAARKDGAVTLHGAQDDSHKENTDGGWALLQRRLEQERAATESFHSQLAAVVSPTGDAGGLGSLPLPRHFEAPFSPIAASLSAPRPLGRSASGGSRRWTRDQPPVLSSAAVTTDSPGYHPLATPRRPLARSMKPNTSGADPLTFDADGVGQSARGVDDPAMETDGDDRDWADSSLSEKVFSVRDRVQSQKQEDLLFEMKLRRMMDSSPLLL